MPPTRADEPGRPDPEALAAIIKLFSQQRYEEVVAAARALTSRYPEDGFGWKALGLAYKYTGHPDALVAMKNAVLLSPGDVDALSNLGNLQQIQGQLEAAEDSLRRALALDARNTAALNNLGLVLYKQLRLTEAENCLRHAVEIDPSHTDAWGNLGLVLHALGHFVEAVICFRRVLESKPEDFGTLNSLGSALQESGRVDEAVQCYQQVLQHSPGHVGALCNLGIAWQEMASIDGVRECHAQLQAVLRKGLPAAQLTEDGYAITALLPYGRSGSLFLHSLLDGHPDVITLPGIYFKGWFAASTWQRFAPDLMREDWRQVLTAKILEAYAPLFNACSRKNVPGRPMDSAWLARDLGLTELGPDQSTHLEIDQARFAEIFIDLLRPLAEIGPRQCFELIHLAWALTVQDTASGSTSPGKHLFFHLHNPNALELAGFQHHYPEARFLYIVRSPLQSMESWMLMDVAPTRVQVDSSNPSSNARYLSAWHRMVGKMMGMLMDMVSPLNDPARCRGLRLEDVKRTPASTLPQLAAWMEIPDHPALYESSFCGMQYWGPTSNLTGKITGFDARPIDLAVGRLLGERDIKVFETLFWPFSSVYGYTTLDEATYRRQLAEIQTWLNVPFDFEVRLYEALPDRSCPLPELAPYRRLHQYLQRLWLLLSQDRVECGIVPLLGYDVSEGRIQ